MTRKSQLNRALAAAAIAAAFLTGVSAALAQGTDVYDKQVFQDCHEVLITLPAADPEKARPLVPKRYPLLSGPPVTVRAANCDYTIDGTTRHTLESEVRIDLDTPAMNETMNEGEENDSHIAGQQVCCDWYELSEASNEKHFATWYKAGTAMDDIVVLAGDLAWRFAPDPITGVGEFHFEAPSPSDWAFEITATLKRPQEPAVAGAINIWHETEEGRQTQVTAHDDREGAGLRLGLVLEGTITAQGSKLRSLLGDSREFGSHDLSAVTAEIENGVLSKRVNRWLP